MNETVTIPKSKLRQIIDHLDHILKLLRGGENLNE